MNGVFLQANSHSMYITYTPYKAGQKFCTGCGSPLHKIVAPVKFSYNPYTGKQHYSLTIGCPYYEHQWRRDYAKPYHNQFQLYEDTKEIIKNSIYYYEKEAKDWLEKPL